VLCACVVHVSNHSRHSLQARAYLDRQSFSTTGRASWQPFEKPISRRRRFGLRRLIIHTAKRPLPDSQRPFVLSTGPAGHALQRTVARGSGIGRIGWRGDLRHTLVRWRDSGETGRSCENDRCLAWDRGGRQCGSILETARLLKRSRYSTIRSFELLG
jgi:hypothetical protein